MSLETTLSNNSIAQTIFSVIVDDLINFNERRLKRKQEYAAKRVKNSGLGKKNRPIKNKRAVNVNGIIYASIMEAALSHDISHSTVIKRCYSDKEKFKDWTFHGLQTSAS